MLDKLLENFSKIRSCSKKNEALYIAGSFPVERCLLNYQIRDSYIRSEAGLSVLESPLNYKLCILLGPTVSYHSGNPSIVAVHGTLVKINNINLKPYLIVNKQATLRRNCFFFYDSISSHIKCLRTISFSKNDFYTLELRK